MKTEINKLPKSTFKISVEHTPEEILAGKVIVLEKIAKKTRIPGFREGKAPLEMVESQLDQNYFSQELLNYLIGKTFPELVKSNKLNPITSPHVVVKEFEPYSKLNYEIEVAEKPEVKIGDYKKLIKAQSKEILTENSSEKILDVVLKAVSTDIPDLMIANEAERMLSRLVTNLTQVGMGLEQFLKTRQQTVEQLQEEYRLGAEKTLKAELAFAELVKLEEIKIEEAEIEETLKANPDEKSRDELSKPENRWYIESILARQKVLAKLLEYAGNDKSQKPNIPSSK